MPKLALPNSASSLTVGIQEHHLNMLNVCMYVEYPKHQVLNMPALSPTMTQGNIGAWKKKIGDPIQPGDVLVEIETDKAQMEFECQEEGYLAQILLPEGTKEAAVGQPLAVIVDTPEDVAKFKDFKATPAERSSAEAATASSGATVKAERTSPSQDNAIEVTNESASKASGDRLFASPLARTTAKSMGVDLMGIKGTGPGGRILRDNIQGAGLSAKPPTSITSNTVAYVDRPLTGMRKVIAQRLTESKQAIPHYYLTVDVIMDSISSIRERLNSHGKGAYKLSVNDFIIKAAARAMSDVPTVNSAWHGSFIREYRDANISVAVATDAGLITPIINQANLKGVLAISTEMKELAHRAKENKLKPEEFQGGSFTISNLGMFGIRDFTAIINPPQSCILAVGGSERRLVPDEKGQPVVKSVMTVTMSCDHRVVDGATGARWLQHFKAYMEDPITILL